MFIRPNTPINESLINEKFLIEAKKMNFAGMNRDVVYTKTIISEKTIAGFLDIEDEYFNYDAVLGTKFLNDMIPDISYSIGYSFTPNHEESHYYKWEKKTAKITNAEPVKIRPNKLSKNTENIQTNMYV